MHNVEHARRQMIDQQVRASEVLDPRVLEALAAVPREHYVPEAYRELAFAEVEIPLGHGQRMFAPMLEGRLLQSLAIDCTDEVLEIGTGSGYLSACLAQLAARVRSLEIHGDFAQSASAALRAAAVANVTVETADAMRLEDRCRYDVIAVTASLPAPDPRFEQALRPGGRLFVVVGQAPAMQALLVTRTGANQWVREPLFETVVAPMIGAVPLSRFAF